MRPPLLPRVLLKLLTTPHLHEAIAGDLEEQWHAAGGRRWWFWKAVARSIVDAWRERLRQDDPGNAGSKGDGLMRSLVYETRHALRMMRQNPGFTLAAVLTLALGIGATTAVFSLVNVFALKPLSYRDPSRVAFVLGHDTETGATRFSLPIADYLDLKRDATSLSSVAAYAYESANLTGGDIPERVQAYRVTANTFEMLGVPAALGRAFTADAGTPGRERVAVISDGLWRRRFGGEPSVVGRRVVLNGTPYEIVGVMPRRFEYPVFNFKGDLWIPWIIPEAAAADRAVGGTGTVVARVADTVDTSAASAQVDTIMRGLASRHPVTNRNRTARLLEMGKVDDEQAGAATLTLPVTVTLVLLLACANVANLLLARGVSRARELAVRVAVGASRARIVGQLLIESFILACCGALGGLALAYIALEALKGALPEMLLLTVPNIRELGIDRSTLAFTMVTVVVSTLIFGVLPAWRAARPAAQAGLKEGAAAGGSRATRRLRTTLVVGEVAMATLLVIVAALLAGSYERLQRVRPGFTPQGLMTMAMTLPGDRYPTPERRRQFYNAAIERVRQLPGVQDAAFVNVLPFSTYDRGMPLVVEGAPLPPAGREPSTALRIVTERYFTTLQIPVRSGRTFDARDGESAARVAVVNERFARQFLGGGPVEGRRVRFGSTTDDAPWIEILGTIGDVNHSDVSKTPSPELYVPLSQANGTALMMLAARTEGRPEDLTAPLRAAILDVDPHQPVFHVKPMQRLVDDSLLASSSAAAFIGGFSVIALLLALVGVWGVVSYGVTQQMPEYGVRLALGATPGALVRLVIRQTAVMAAAGIAIGASVAAAAGGALEKLMLYGVSGRDVPTYAIVVTALFVLALLASVVPARRAASAEPLRALRAE